MDCACRATGLHVDFRPPRRRENSADSEPPRDLRRPFFVESSRHGWSLQTTPAQRVCWHPSPAFSGDDWIWGAHWKDLGLRIYRDYPKNPTACSRLGPNGTGLSFCNEARPWYRSNCPQEQEGSPLLPHLGASICRRRAS